MDKQAMLAELTADEIKALPQFKAILEELEADEAAQTRITELEATNTAQTTRIEELEASLSAQNLLVKGYQEKEFKADLDGKIAELTNWDVHGEEAQAKLDALRGVIKQMATVKLGDVREMDQAEETLKALLDGDLKALVEMTRDSLAGGPAVIGSRGRQDDKISELTPYDDTEEGREKDKAWMGLNV